MTPRERILAALERRPVDRLPIDFAGTDCSSIHLVACHEVRRHLGLAPRTLRLGCATQQVTEVDPDLLDRFGSDAVGLYFHPRQWRVWDEGHAFPVEVPDRWRPERQADGSDVVRDARGIARGSFGAGGAYFDPVNPILANASSPADLAGIAPALDRWDWAAALDESIEEYAARARQLRAGTDRAVVALWRMHYLQAGQILRGYEQFLIDLLTDEPLARAVLDPLHAVYLDRTKRFLAAMADAVDVVFFTDDLGTQNAPLVGPDTYRRLIKPYWAELIGLIKAHGKKVLMHSCGAISDFLPDLIEIGVDAVNPVQVSAAGMDPARLKREFGNDITFWGGGVNTQGVLDRADPATVTEEVRRNIGIFAADGTGYVFTQVHNIQPDVPPANIIAAFEAARRV
ncbi:hypothetical protein HQ590_06385 [bacterium]|nr:hypothetical protein [bacterium]